MSNPQGRQKIQVNRFQILFTKKKLTAYGGYSLLAKFFEKIGLHTFFEHAIPIVETSPNALGLYPKALAFILMLFSGGKRFAHLLYLGESKDVMAGLFGVKRLPEAPTTLTRFFGKLCSWKKVASFQECLWEFLMRWIPWKKLQTEDLSFDSHVCIRYGKQEGAKKGYNPKKPGRPTHHPILAFLNRGRYVVNLWNRSGNASSANNAVAFLEETLRRLGERLKVRTVFADSGFYQLPFLQALEQFGKTYIVAVTFHQVIQKVFFSEKLSWNEVAPGIEMAEFSFRHDKWDKERRYFVIRERCRKDKPMLGKQLSIFPEQELSKNYRYRAYVTSSGEDVKALWDRYRPRADDENRIKELVEDFGFNGFCLNSFYATEAAMLTLCLMYNLFNLFRHEILSESESTERASTVRYQYWVIPAITGQNGNQPLLRLGIVSAKVRAKMRYLFSRLEHVFSGRETQLQCN